MANGMAVSINDPGTDKPWDLVEQLQKVTDLTGLRISFNSTAVQVIVAAAALQTVRVHRLRINVAGATNLSIQNTAGTVIEVFQFLGAGSVILDFDARAYYTTIAGAGLQIVSSAAVQVEGRINYVQGV